MELSTVAAPLFIFRSAADREGGFGNRFDGASAVKSGEWSVSAGLPEGADVLDGRPSRGLSAGAASESGCASFRSLKCRISNLLSPLLYEPTSSLTVDLDGLLSILKGPSQGV